MNALEVIPIPGLPLLAVVLCGLCCTNKALRVAAAPVAVLAIAGSFIFSFALPTDASTVVSIAPWINIGGLDASFSCLVDPLTRLMLLIITGIGALVTIYGAGYMSGDRGYARFFAFVSLFIFAMTTLVLANNLVLLYLGWEGVGLCSYLLIGFYYQRPTAVAAAKKAFIVNRIGDLGFALGIFLTFVTFDTVQIDEIVKQASGLDAAQATAAHRWIPFLLMLGAFGKSAQLPLHVWLPDAMEGPTPVSALIHAATMVTAGVYMIGRLLPVFALSPHALTTIAVVGGSTALFAATVAMCQHDLKRVFAWSTISQLGYMFLGVGVLASVGGFFHLFTHAFFKALLFLTAGSVIHALAGQLDMREISGLRRRMPVTCALMLAGCLALAGVPFIAAGYYSKDMIIADVLARGLHHGGSLYMVLGIMALFTAFLTAYYTFRLWFSVFLGPLKFTMGSDHAGAEESGHAGDGQIQVEHHHEPHEMGWLMNGPLVILAIGAILAGVLGKDFVSSAVNGSTADPGAAHDEHAVLLGMSLHTFLPIASSAASLGGIAVAAYFHWLRRERARAIAASFSGLIQLLRHGYRMDELYDTAVRRTLRLVGEVAYLCDRLVIDGLVALVGFAPRLAGLIVQPAQRGRLQGYGLGMILGTTAIVFLVFVVWKAE